MKSKTNSCTGPRECPAREDLVLDPVVERLHLLQVAALVVAEEEQVRLVLHLPLLVLPLAPGEGAIVLSHEASHGSVLLTAHLE